MKPGDTVTLTTKYKESYYYSDEEFRYTTYENVTVLTPEPWMKPGQIKISSDDPRMPFRIIETKNISDCSVDIAVREPTVREVKVKGSKGNEYTVVVQDGHGVSCTCPGFTYRRHCRHLASV